METTRREFVRQAAVCAAGLVGAGSLARAAESRPERPMNVVFLLSDDQRWDSLGCMGNEAIRTPSIDALARDGMRFTRACVTTSICMVSRASILTGQYMSRHRIREFNVSLLPAAFAETYPAVLRRAGYWTGYVGKYGVAKIPADQFDWCGEVFEGKHWVTVNGQQVHATEVNTRDALRFLHDRPKERPFCLTVGFAVPHAVDEEPRQYLPQPQSEEAYRDVRIPLPKTATDEHFRKLPPFLATTDNEGRRRWTKRFDTPEHYQEYMKNYYRLITEMDAGIGRIIEELKAQGVYENTLIIFIGDNGYFHAEHGLADKWYPYEESIRVPLVVHDPRLPKERRGMASDELVLNIDIAPTLIAAAGAPVPTSMQGCDFAPLYLASKPTGWRDEFYYEHPIVLAKDRIPASEAVVRRNCKYIYWPDFAYEELFDLKQDPLEERNLAADPSHAAVLAEMRRSLQRWRERVSH